MNPYTPTDTHAVRMPVLPVLLTTLLTLLLSIAPLPTWSIWLRPEVAVILVVYWTMTLSFKLGMVYAWIVGLLLDLLLGSVLGQHALALTILAYFMLLIHQRTIIYSLGQQALGIFVLVLVYELLNYWIYGLTGGAYFDSAIVLTALSSALLWPMFKLFFDLLRRYL